MPLHPRLQAMLRGYSGWIFPNGLGGHITTSALQHRLEVVQKHLVLAGQERFTYHQLRHYFGTETSRLSKGNVVLVGALMGHEAPSTTMGYIKPHLVDGAEVIAQLTGGHAQVDDELAARRCPSRLTLTLLTACGTQGDGRHPLRPLLSRARSPLGSRIRRRSRAGGLLPLDAGRPSGSRRALSRA